MIPGGGTGFAGWGEMGGYAFHYWALPLLGGWSGGGMESNRMECGWMTGDDGMIGMMNGDAMRVGGWMDGWMDGWMGRGFASP
jgi:hypothetical protein